MGNPGCRMDQTPVFSTCRAQKPRIGPVTGSFLEFARPAAPQRPRWGSGLSIETPVSWNIVRSHRQQASYFSHCDGQTPPTETDTPLGSCESGPQDRVETHDCAPGSPSYVWCDLRLGVSVESDHSRLNRTSLGDPEVRLLWRLLTATRPARDRPSYTPAGLATLT